MPPWEQRVLHRGGNSGGLVIGSTVNPEACQSLVIDRAPWASGMGWQANVYDDAVGDCFAFAAVDELPEQDLDYTPNCGSCIFYTDPGTPCMNCAAGKYSGSTGTNDPCISCAVGRYAPPGSATADDCEACLPGWVDADADAQTPCVPCAPGTFSNATGRTLGCDSCPLGSTSAAGSLGLTDCKPTVAAMWTDCEPCASQPKHNTSTEEDPLGIFANSGMPFCVNDVIVKVHVGSYGAEYMWEFDGGESFAYTDDHDGDSYVHNVGLSLAREQHIFNYHDTYGDGWNDGGYWQMFDACGGTIGGGYVDGRVSGTGGSFSFDTVDMCCACQDDPDGILNAMYTSCALFLGRVNNNCEADASDFVTSAPPDGIRVSQLCPVTCGTCNAQALNTTQRTCGLCPVGFGLNEISNTYEDLDECARNDGGCDPLMGYYVGASWKIEPCTNTQGSFTCNSCPDGFEQVGNSCQLPVVPSTGNQTQSGTSDVASVQPKSSLVIAGPATALVAGSDEQAAFIEAVRADIAVSLEVDSSDFLVNNIVRGRRRVQSTVETVGLRFDIHFVNDNAQELVVAMIKQLADPISPLMNGDTTGQLLPDQVPEIAFVCPIGKVRPDGESLCRKCASPAFANGDGVTCVDCPTYQIPTSRGDACTCEAGYYNMSAVQPTCHTDSFVETLQAVDATIECKPCRNLDCIDSCQGSSLAVKQGWAPQARDDGINVAIFLCKEQEACPGGDVRADKTLCNEGYSDILCGVCASDDYALKDGKTCTLCGTTSTAGFVATIVLIIVLIAVAMNIQALYSTFTGLQAIADLMQALQLKVIGKCLLATMQILSNLAVNLKVDFPLNYKVFLSGIIRYFRFDIMIILEFGCVTDGGYTQSLFGNCLVVVVIIAMVLAQYFYRENRDENAVITEEEGTKQAKFLFEKFDQDGDGIGLNEVASIVQRINPDTTPEQIEAIFRSADKDGSNVITFDEFYEATQGSGDGKARDTGEMLDLGLVVKQHLKSSRQSDALTKVFLLVFLLYPGLTNKIFEGLICRDLGGEPLSSVLEVDYSIDCEEDKALRYVRQLLLVVIWPIGLPAMLFLWMYHAKDLILAEDEDTLQKFDFVLGDYKRGFWFWEVVELSRKLILSGLIGIFGRGTIAQSFAAVFISFFFFGLSVYAQPFRTDRMNRLKMFSEFQIFGILLVCIVLQTNKNGLPDTGLATESFYGNVQLAFTVSIIPLVAYFVQQNMVAVRDAAKEKLAQADDSVFDPAMANPLAQDLDEDTAES
eukprot:COSAG06_NODE_3065_length_5901_cov_5.700965_2_plen_1264_part_00